MARHIVVPLDMSAFAEFALPVAYSVLKDGDRLELVSVAEPPLPLAWEGFEEVATEGLERYQADMQERVRASVGREVEVITALLRGDPAIELSRYVEQVDADLVVMTSHGRGPLNRLWLGSVTDGLVRHTTVPVLIVRPREDEEMVLQAMPRPLRILVPLDGSETSEEVLERLSLLGAPTEQKVHLTRVVTYPRSVASAYLPHTVLENQVTLEEECGWADDYLKTVVDKLAARGIEDVTYNTVMSTTAATGILDEVAAVDCEVIALSTHARTGVSRLVLGSVADKVIRGADRPVLVVPAPHSREAAEHTSEGSVHSTA